MPDILHQDVYDDVPQGYVLGLLLFLLRHLSFKIMPIFTEMQMTQCLKGAIRHLEWELSSINHCLSIKKMTINILPANFLSELVKISVAANSNNEDYYSHMSKIYTRIF